MFENVYAHTKKNDTDKRRWQTLKDHLEGTADLAEKFAEKFGSGGWGRVAGMLHDLGKAHDAFQKYLEEVNKNSDEKLRCVINHSDAGAIYAERNLGSFVGRTLAYIVAGHHAGLPDSSGGLASLAYRTQDDDRNQKNLVPLTVSFNTIETQIQKNTLTPPKTFTITSSNYNFWVRFLFSCLVDADSLDSENFDEPQKTAQRGRFKSLQELKKDFDDHMKRFNQTPPPNESEDVARLRVARNDVLTACRQAGRSEEGGVYTLSVPTGGGKTLSSMAFALEKAIKLNKDRIIYVVPFTTIIEQTGEKFAEIFGRENVVEHHCNFDGTKRKKEEEKEKDADQDEYNEYLHKIELATENWDAPIVVTTNVQFFESLFAAKKSRCRKLHNIVNSVVILDEAQALSTDFIAPCVEALNVLSESFGVVPVLCTATQPAFEHIDKADSTKKYTKLKKTIPIIKPELEARLFADLARVQYKFDSFNQRRSWDELAEELALSENNEVLCVVNTRRDCYELYQALKKQVERQENARTICLSALMCGEHRSEIIKEIRTVLEQNRTQKKKTPLRVVATQLVEAGVDIDFPVVYRALAGLDSIVQAGGRCNREGKLGREGGKVIVFTPPKSAPKGTQLHGEEATRELIGANPTINVNSQEVFTKYFPIFYGRLETLDSIEIVDKLTKNVNNKGGQPPEIPYRTVGEEFKLIEDGFTLPVVVKYSEESSKLIERLKVEGVHKELMRKIQRHTVNLQKSDAFKKIDDRVIVELYPGIYVQEQLGYYSDEFGFDCFRTTTPMENCFV